MDTASYFYAIWLSVVVNHCFDLCDWAMDKGNVFRRESEQIQQSSLVQRVDEVNDGDIEGLCIVMIQCRIKMLIEACVQQQQRCLLCTNIFLKVGLSIDCQQWCVDGSF